jgi:hypothetical protein
MGAAPRVALRVTKGEELVTKYQWNTMEVEHFFCKVCGIYTHHFMRGERETAGINMACIENFDIYALGEVEVGEGKNWSVVGGASAA